MHINEIFPVVFEKRELLWSDEVVTRTLGKICLLSDCFLLFLRLLYRDLSDTFPENKCDILDLVLPSRYCSETELYTSCYLFDTNGDSTRYWCKLYYVTKFKKSEGRMITFIQLPHTWFEEQSIKVLSH